MRDYRFIKGYRDDDVLRKSFNQLALDTFGISFEKWYKLGFWTDKYEPYSFAEGNNIIANVSVNKINLIISGERKSAIQIGTVMTHPDYRGKGLSGALMNKVMEDFQDVDLIYLFANSTVLDYYPKFGFRSVGEQQPVMKLSGSGEGITLQKLDADNKEDLSFIHKLAERKVPVAKTFSTTDTAELLLFYCTYVFPDDIYYWAEEETVILMKKEGSILHLFDVISPKEIDLKVLATEIATPEIKEVHFHFTFQNSSENFTTVPFKGDEVLFVKTANGLVLPETFKHPITSQA
ncbi:GNAT family N-acetyltransferase [Bacillus salacetis]|uniref:GNAT family N-acetyltransferase n=1 Tax=Bacillus salacetis TaxID=2315464 RepID=UPI003BA15361